MKDYRPAYHLHPLANWMNDPNGAIEWKGRYHLFYQHNPYETISRQKHWAHVVSDDMLHWETLPIALAPTPGGYDKDGCFSGCMVINRGIPTIIYTGVRPEVQCLATSNDEMMTWQKYPGNPVLKEPPPGLETLNWRDPYVWHEKDEAWYMLLSSGFPDEGGACLLYRSEDLIDWEYLHPLIVGNIGETGPMWDCPSFLPIGDLHLLLASGESVWKPFYYSGDYQDHHFSPRHFGLVDYGSAMYAPQVFADEAGRVILWGWLWENRPDDEIRQAGWEGVMALPRLLSLNPDGSLAAVPAPEIERLRQKHTTIRKQHIRQGEKPLDAIRGESMEIRARFQTVEPAARLGLGVFCTEDGEERTLIGYDTAKQEVFIDRSHSKLQPTMAFNWPNPSYHAAPLALTQHETLDLRIFLDHSVIEVFTNRGLCLASRVYPEGLDSTHVILFSEGGESRLISLDAWDLEDINHH